MKKIVLKHVKENNRYINTYLNVQFVSYIILLHNRGVQMNPTSKVLNTKSRGTLSSDPIANLMIIDSHIMVATYYCGTTMRYKQNIHEEILSKRKY